MSWRDAALLTARSIRRRLGRAVLTVLAVTLAATLLAAMLIVAGAARTRVLDQLAKGGPVAGIKVAAAEPDPGALDTDNPRPGAPRDLDDDAVHRIAALPGVRSVVPLESTPVLAIPLLPGAHGRAAARAHDTAPFRDTLAGLDIRRVGHLPLTLLRGRLPAPGARDQVAVTEGYLRRLGLRITDAGAVVGTQLELGAPRVFDVGDRVSVRGRWTRSRIVGVVAQEAVPAQFVAPIEAVRAAKDWTAASVDTTALDLPTSKYSGLFVVADGLGRVGSVRAAITRIGYSTSAPENLIASVQRYLRVVEIVLTGIGLVALGIAALGITNALLAAVRERRREIGVLKAIGARDRDVRRVFLLEATTLGLLGGLLGTTVGWLIARIMGAVVNGYLTDQGLRGVDAGFPAVVVVAGVGNAVLALAAGVVPAQRAARLPARQAVGDG